MTLELDVNTWAAEQFESCDLGDARRTARAVTMAAQFAANPSGSTPEQTETWADCKAAYRLFDCADVTFSGLARPHWQRTKARTSGHYLLLGDTTVVSFDGERNISGMGIVTDGSAKGYLLHSSLMVTADSSHQVLGLAGQTIYYRQRVSKQEKQRQRLQRKRESEIWGEVIDQVGPPLENVRFTHVFDRGGDNFEVYCHLLLNQCDWVVRAAQLKRLIVTPAGQQTQLGEYLQSCPVVGTYELEVKANHNQPARTALVEVRFGAIGLPAPRDCGRFAHECGITFITMHAVEVREVHPPPGVEPLRWVLLTSHAVATFEEALEVITYYEQRPLIEEFHKALKTGCRLEDRLYETAQRWEAVTAMLSIVAVRLLQLKTVATADPDRPAEELVPRKWIEMLSAVRRGKHQRIRTAYQFMRALAGLGGHLGRKSDGEPGWITLWRGFNKLHLLLRGAAAINKKCG
ncbi:MAG: IS4 family transposase [Acidobacteria bacterium]|nr:IS4 family transposase [Acidobacteriota bacterium]